MPITEPDFTQVAVGIAVDTEQRLLVAQRPSGKDFAGQWEFPGGKIEAEEDVYDALVREFKEELNLEIRAATPLFSCRSCSPRNLKASCIRSLLFFPYLWPSPARSIR